MSRLILKLYQDIRPKQRFEISYIYSSHQTYVNFTNVLSRKDIKHFLINMRDS